jgi:hypothetical protein
MSSLNIKICDIVSDGLYTMSYKSGSNPCPTNNGFTTIGTGLTATTITLTGLTFNTQYWVKMTDESSNRYIIRNISTNHSKTYPCYDTMCFNVVTDCDEPTPTPTITPTPTPPCCSQWTYYFSGSTSGVNIIYQNCENVTSTTSVFGISEMVPQVFGCVYPGTTPYFDDTQWGGILTNTNQCC